MKARIFAFLCVAAIAASGFAAPLSLGVGTATVDGAIGQGEYANFATLSGIGFGSSLSADGSVLTLAVQAPTTGWVAIGLGANVMNGAWMLLAYDDGVKPAYSEQLGAGHFHKAVTASKLLKSVVKQSGGVTVLEVQVKAADFIKDGNLPVIMAYGKSADFVSRHVKYAMTSLVVAK